MPTIESIVSRGYFPKELPPSFSTTALGQLLEANRSSLQSRFTPDVITAKLASHNLARSGTLRRKLSIPNPIFFYYLANTIVTNWQQLESFTATSHLSLSKPVECRTGRAIDRQFDLHERALQRMKPLTRSKDRGIGSLTHPVRPLAGPDLCQTAPPLRSGRHIPPRAEDRGYLAVSVQNRSTARYILQADITRFYHSIYTHSIPWALHTKAVAKRNRSDRLIGNVLDKLVRNSQDGQTMGVPIGPDTSLLIAEIVLSAVDDELRDLNLVNGFRYIDDYEFAFPTLSAAESAICSLQNVLHRYELALNPQKTKILELPLPAEHPAISEIRIFNFRSSSVGQQSDLLRFFDRAFTLAKEDPEESIIRYAVSRLSGVTFSSTNYSLLERLLLQSMMAEPGAIRLVLNQLIRLRNIGYRLDDDQIAEALNSLIQQHAPQGHGSEVAWAIWGLIVLRLPLESQSAQDAVSMNDSVVAILLLDARNKSLTPPNTDISHIQSIMTTEELYGEQWLLCYEANVKRWVRSRGRNDHVNRDQSFAFLK